MTQILIFSPFGLWIYHAAYEDTIALACKVRGAKVDYLRCDGLLPECDLHWDSKENAPRPFDLCQRCQAAAKSTMHSIGAAYRWLGDFVSTSETEAAFSWAQEMRVDNLRNATFEELPLGQWVQSSVISYFRQYPPDLNNWHVVSVYRGFLYSAAIVAIGLRNYLKKNKVDAAILFNGRQSITRVALELFRQSGIRVLTHERPEYSRGHINVRPNTHCMNLNPFGELWKEWAEIALDRPALEATHKWLLERKTGVNLAWLPFNSGGEPETSFRAKMGFRADKQLWVLFTSSTDETAGDPVMKGPFESQYEFVCGVVQWAAERSDVQLIVKVHPNLGGNSYIGKAVNELRLYEELKPTLPDNVRIALPEDLMNAYLLAEEADIGLAFGSLIGLEMAMLGKPVLLAARSLYENCSTILKVRSKEALPEMLEKCLAAKTDREIQREAFRLAYCYISRFEMEFPALKILGINEVEPSYSQPEEFEVGKDKSLDRICNYVMSGSPLYESPNEFDIARTTSEEDAFFDELRNPPRISDNTTADESKSSQEPRDLIGKLVRRLFFSARNALSRRSVA